MYVFILNKYGYYIMILFYFYMLIEICTVFCSKKEVGTIGTIGNTIDN